MKNKLGSCRINECTISEARKPLKFFNSLFLLRTSANTISCSAVVHIQDALNGKEVDWPALYYEHIKMELISLKEGLYKDMNSGMRTLVGPPLTMWLISNELLTVQQEIDAGILMPSKLEERPLNKKRKLDYELDHTRGNSSSGEENPQIMVANIHPAIANTAFISTPGIGTSDVQPSQLQDIHWKFSQACQLLQSWIKGTSTNGLGQVPTTFTEFNKEDSSAQTQISVLEAQIQSLNVKCAEKEVQNHNLTIAFQLEKKELRQQYAAAEAQNHKLAAAHQLEKEEIHSQYILLQDRYAATEDHLRQAAAETEVQNAKF